MHAWFAYDVISLQGDLDLFGHRSPFLPDLQQWEWDPRRPTLSQGKQDWIAVWGENQKNCGQIFNMIEIQVGRAPLQDSSVQWVFQVGSQLKIHKSNWNRLPCHALNMPCANLCKRTFFRICWLKTKDHSNLGWAWPGCSQRRCGKRRSSNSGRLKITCVCITYYVMYANAYTYVPWLLFFFNSDLAAWPGHAAEQSDPAPSWTRGQRSSSSSLSLFSSSSSPGNYTCSLPGELSSLGEHTVRVHILDYELPVAVHSG